jgi:serine/threonine-protein kinase RsbW
MERLTVPGTLDSLEPIGKYVLAAASEAGLDRKAAYRLRLAVDELATNVIVHGYQESRLNGQIDLWTDIDDQHLSIGMEDSGTPYDPLKTPPPPDLDEPLEDRRIGGLGIYLAKMGVTDLRYERVGNHNRTVFVVSRPAVRPVSNQ